MMPVNVQNQSRLVQTLHCNGYVVEVAEPPRSRTQCCSTFSTMVSRWTHKREPLNLGGQKRSSRRKSRILKNVIISRCVTILNQPFLDPPHIIIIMHLEQLLLRGWFRSQELVTFRLQDFTSRPNPLGTFNIPRTITQAFF